MARELPLQFESIEAAYEYVSLLSETALEARRDVAEQQAVARERGAARREQGFQLAAYKLAQLGIHLNASRRLLNDLRTLRRLLSREEQVTQGPQETAAPAPARKP